MINIDKAKAKENIEEIVKNVGIKKGNYIFINNKFITQEIMIYSDDIIITFFVKIRNKDFKLQKFCYHKSKNLIVHSFFYHLIVSRIMYNEYRHDDFENIKYDEEKNKLSFFGNCGWRHFKIAKYDIYGFNQSEQIEKLKEFVNKTNIKI